MLVTILAMMSMAMNAGIITYESKGLIYQLNTGKKTAELTGYMGSETEIVIPENVRYGDVDYTVTTLGYSCFQECSFLTSVKIPSSVTTLGDHCFYG